jgi:hypothetical protein
MSFFFGDSFDLYAASADAFVGGSYWDSGTSSTAASLAAGRFTGSHAISFSSSVLYVTKSSGVNDSVHHFNLGFNQTLTPTGATTGFYIELFDGATAQCSVLFRSDGAIVLLSGVPGSATVLATYTGAVTTANTWYGFEIEVVIHNTAGSFKVRKNGNTSDDFSATSLNTRGGTANNYANKISLGMNNPVSTQIVDDFLWRSDASSVAWAGELRCYTRMPVTDSSVQWTPSAAVVPMANYPEAASSNNPIATAPKYMPFVAVCDGTIATVSMPCITAATANFKCAIYASGAGVPTTVLGSANVVTNPGVGTTTWTFPTPVAVTRGTIYYVAVIASASSGNHAYLGVASSSGYSGYWQDFSSSYAAFPVANPTSLSGGLAYKVIINITPTLAVNAPFVADIQQDAAATYVSSSTPGQTDLYNIAPITGTPTGIIGVTTRALCQKSDAGTRNVALCLRSGATDVTGTSTALSTTFGWVFRTDTTDPNTGSAWSAVSVNNLNVGIVLAA